MTAPKPSAIEIAVEAFKDIQSWSDGIVAAKCESALGRIAALRSQQEPEDSRDLLHAARADVVAHHPHVLEAFDDVLLRLESPPSAAPTEAEGAKGSRYLFVGYGESDFPVAIYSDDPRSALAQLIFGNPNERNEELDGHVEAFNDPDEWGEGCWLCEFEIGGVRAYRLEQTPIQQAPQAEAVHQWTYDDLWKDGVPPETFLEKYDDIRTRTLYTKPVVTAKAQEDVSALRELCNLYIKNQHAIGEHDYIACVTPSGERCDDSYVGRLWLRVLALTAALASRRETT